MTQNPSVERQEAGGALKSITHGASIFFIGKILSNVTGFLLTFVLTRYLGASLYGIYTYVNTVLSVFMIFARLGTGESLLKFIPASSDNPRRQNWVTGLAYLTALIASTIIGIIIFVLAPIISSLTLEEPLLVHVLRIFSIVLPFNTLINLTNALFRALEKLEYQVLLKDLLRPLINLLCAGTALILGYSLIGVAAALAIGALLTFAIALSLLHLKTDIRPFGEHSPGSKNEFFDFSLPLTFKDLGESLYNRVDIIIIGLFLSSSVVGIYRVSILLTTLLTLPLAGVNQLFPAIASELYANDKINELDSVYKTITRWVLTIVVPPLLTLIIYSPEVLRIFGSEFVSGSSVLILFSVAQLTNCSVGPSGFLLMMTDNHYLNLLNQWLLGGMNIVLNYIFILEFGLIGAAVATAGTLAFINLLRVLEVWYTERLTPYSRNYWKPIVAGLISAATMFSVRFVADGYSLLIIGSCIGTLVYLTLLIVFGVEEKDRKFFLDNIKPMIESVY